MTALHWEQVEPFGRMSVPGRSRWQLKDLLFEVSEYFDCGASLPDDAVVFDVGANIGAFALAAAHRAGPQLTLYCFEPVPPIFSALEANTRENQLLADVSTNLFPVALGADRGSADLSYFRRFPTDSTIDIDSKRKDFEMFFAHHGERLRKRAAPVISDRVARPMSKLVASIPKGPVGRWLTDQVMGRVEFQCPLLTLSSVIEEHGVERIDLLKIDVEGAELEVLRGIRDEHWGRFQQVVLEGHDHGGRLETIKKLLEDQGFEIAHVQQPDLAEDRGLDSFLLYAKR